MKSAAEKKKLHHLRDQIAYLTEDACNRLKLPHDKTPEELVKLLRKFHRIERHECYYVGRREPTYHGELYQFYKELIDKWTIVDVNEAIKECARLWKLTKQKATCKIMIQHAPTSSYTSISWTFPTILRSSWTSREIPDPFQLQWC